MKCSVVIPCHNGVELTRLCITSLLEQTAPPHEILVVDNASDDGTDGLAAEFAPTVRVLRQDTNLGFGGGVNAGIARATGDHLLVVNNDTQAAPNLLAELHRALHHVHGIGAVAPVSNHVKGEAHVLVGEVGRDPQQRRELSAELQNAPILQDVETLAGLCLMLRRTTLQEIGVFDERFGHGNYEDDDLCLRLRLHGYRLAVARRAFLHHEGHATFRAMGLDLEEVILERLSRFRAKWEHHPAGLATLAHMHQDLRIAAIAAEEARRRCPLWTDAWLHLGRFHEQFGAARDAISHLQTYLRHCPENVEAQLCLGLAQVRDGRQQEGQKTLERALRRHRPTTGQETRMLERLGQLAYESGQHAAALAHFSSATSLMSERNELHHWRGLCLLAMDRVAEARDAFARAAELGHALAHTNLGICQHRSGDEEAALRSFERAVEMLPDDPVARANYEAGLAARSAVAS